MKSSPRGFALLLLALSAPVFALPLTYGPLDKPAIDDARTLGSLPMRAVSPALATKAVAALPRTKGTPLAVAASVPLALGLDDGRWDSPTPGLSRWRLQVFSANAQTLSFEFARFALPPSAGLWIYDQKGTLIQGPYTAANHTPEGKLWTAMIEGNTAVIELRVADAEKSAVQLALGQVQHGTVNIAKAGASNTAGACNIDVACSQGDNWRDQIRSVARYTVTSGNTTYLCTGQLVNNVRQDSTPYFLTANHCHAGDNPSSVVAYWNYQNSTCSPTVSDGSLSQSQSGASLKAQAVRSDFTLLQLSQTPPSSYNVYYTGWDATGNAPQSGVAVHHPSGDVKKISVYSSPASKADGIQITEDNETRTVDAWAVKWAQGTTESGSSGAGLYNSSKQIVGVLSGGDAACTSAVSTTNNGGTDYFARTAVAWTTDSCNSAGQLKVWLDPDNGGVLSLCGQNPGSPCSTAVRTSGSATPGALPASCGSGSSTGSSTTTSTGTTTVSNNGNRGGGAFGFALLPLAAMAWARRRRGASSASTAG